MVREEQKQINVKAISMSQNKHHTQSRSIGNLTSYNLLIERKSMGGMAQQQQRRSKSKERQHDDQAQFEGDANADLKRSKTQKGLVTGSASLENERVYK